MDQASAMMLALLGGFVPALFWLWFWLREDAARPEPRILIFVAFLSGIAVVPIALAGQLVALERFSGAALILVWVILEEVLKYVAALAVILWQRAVDEPIDCIIYMITVALGFSALENALFLFTPLAGGAIAESLLTGHFRFVGATLLHVLASGTVGVFMALTFYRSTFMRVTLATFGLCIAVVLHALFNFLIMNARGGMILSIFLFVWIGIIVLFILFETAKRIQTKRNL